MAHKPRRILVVKLADLGDVLICEPAIRSLRLAFPDAKIDVLVPSSSAGIVELLGHDTSVIAFPKHAFDNPVAISKPANLAFATRFALHLRSHA